MEICEPCIKGTSCTQTGLVMRLVDEYKASPAVQQGRRSFLFLQGVASPFFARLGDYLIAQGHRVHKVNFNAGDVLYWGTRPATLFRGAIEDLSDFLEVLYRKHNISDQLVFGDCRHIHLGAIELARRWGIRNHVCEEGYYRPYWFTLEREGVNMHSLLPRDPDWYLDVGSHLPKVGEVTAFASPFSTRALHDVVYHLAGVCNPLVFPRYRTHAIQNAAQEYAGYARRLPLLRFHAPGDKSVIQKLIRKRTPFFFLPLQLNGDAQIRSHSGFSGIEDVLHHVLSSFARHAPANTRLVIKNHPLDMWQLNYPRILSRLEDQFDLRGRVDYLETGSVPALLRHAKGVVTVNSTVGTLALSFGKSTIALGQAIYNMRGMTYQGSLDQFWHDPASPDKKLVDCFQRTVIHTTQLNGGLHSRAGIDLAIVHASRSMTAQQSPLEELL